MNNVLVMCRGRGVPAWRRLFVRPSTALVLHLSCFTAHARCFPAGIGYSNAGGSPSDAISTAPQDFPLRSDGPTGKLPNYPFKLDPLNLTILGETLFLLTGRSPYT